MWVWAIFGLVALGIWLIITGTYRLAVGFSYTKRSYWGLALCGALAMVASWYSGFRLLTLPVPFNALASLAFVPVFFVLFGNVMVELWIRTLLRQFDARIESLMEAEHSARVQMEGARDRVHTESLRQQESRERNREIFERLTQLEHQVDTWQQSGGVARVRSLRVDEWKSKFQSLDENRLAAEREQIKREISSLTAIPDQEGQERLRQLRTELAVLDIEVIRRHTPKDGEVFPVHNLIADQERVKRTMEETQREIAALRQQRTDFLRKRIRLE